MAQAYKCDECGSYFLNLDHQKLIMSPSNEINVSPNFIVSHYHFCKDCFINKLNAIITFLRTGE